MIGDVVVCADLVQLIDDDTVADASYKIQSRISTLVLYIDHFRHEPTKIHEFEFGLPCRIEAIVEGVLLTVWVAALADCESKQGLQVVFARLTTSFDAAGDGDVV